MGTLRNLIAHPVLIVHNPVDPGDDPATTDVLDQMRLVASGFAELGVPARPLAVPDGRPWEALAAAPNLLVFNLIESPPGAPYVCGASTGALEGMGITFTGAPAAAIWLTTDKIKTRAVLAAAGIPVAPGGLLDLARPDVLERVPPPWIVKPACEDASVGLEDNPVCACREEALARAAGLARRFPGQPILVERYLPGREFNVSVLEGEDGPEVLPVAEMTFLDYPPDMPRIMGYDAKWVEDTFAYDHTARSFAESAEDGPLYNRLREVALAAWSLSGIAGYGRVDMRLDESGEPCVLEVNANPCIAADAGLVAAAERAGLTHGGLVERIALAALRRRSAAHPPRAEGTVRVALPAADLDLRDGLAATDRPALASLLAATGFFNQEEVSVAMELVDARLAEGPACHYRFLVAECDGRVAGYACWGAIPGTRSAADLYWIAVDPAFQRRGVGAALLAAAEERMAAEGRHRIYVETSTRPQYEPTRRFYLGNGYHLAAELPDFYAPEDGKAVFLKVVGAAAARAEARPLAPPTPLRAVRAAGRLDPDERLRRKVAAGQAGTRTRKRP